MSYFIEHYTLDLSEHNGVLSNYESRKYNLEEQGGRDLESQNILSPISNEEEEVGRKKRKKNIEVKKCSSKKRINWPQSGRRTTAKLATSKQKKEVKFYKF